MKKNKILANGSIAVLLILCFLSTSCLQYSTKTNISLESYPDTVTVYKKDSYSTPTGSTEQYVSEEKTITRYKIIKEQNTYFDWGKTILKTSELISSILFSIGMALWANWIKSI